MTNSKVVTRRCTGQHAAILGGPRVDCAELLLKAGAAVNVWFPGTRARHLTLQSTEGIAVRGRYFCAPALSSPMVTVIPYIWRVKSAGGFKKYAQNPPRPHHENHERRSADARPAASSGVPPP